MTDLWIQQSRRILQLGHPASMPPCRRCEIGHIRPGRELKPFLESQQTVHLEGGPVRPKSSHKSIEVIPLRTTAGSCSQRCKA